MEDCIGGCKLHKSNKAHIQSISQPHPPSMLRQGIG
jgi:hypothetical protein